ncbi:MAG: hypothetical protein GU356_04100 [Pyrobaculum sp.]|nr:hypothetical protein [Pyrobaculum sp.]
MACHLSELFGAGACGSGCRGEDANNGSASLNAAALDVSSEAASGTRQVLRKAVWAVKA